MAVKGHHPAAPGKGFAPLPSHEPPDEPVRTPPTLPVRPRAVLLLPVAALCGACTATTVPSYDVRPPAVRLEARGLAGGDLVLGPRSGAVERELAAAEELELAVLATDAGGVRRVALVGRLTVGCYDPETGAQTLDVTEVVHDDEAVVGPGGTVRTSAQVSRLFRASDHRVTCADPDARPWVEGTFHGEAEDFHGRWSATGSFTFWRPLRGDEGTSPDQGSPCRWNGRTRSCSYVLPVPPPGASE